MPKMITLAAIRAKVTFQGDFENSRVFTPALIDVMINEAIEEFWDLLLDGRPETLMKTASLAAVASQDYVTLPADFYRLRLVEILDGTFYRVLRPHSVSEAWRYQLAPATPVGFTYRIEGGPDAANPIVLRIAPTPAGVHTIRIKYFPPATDLVDDGNELDTVNGYDSLVVARTIAKLKGGREGSDSSWWDKEAARCEQGVRQFAAPVDAGEPMALSGQAGFHPYWDEVPY